MGARLLVLWFVIACAGCSFFAKSPGRPPACSTDVPRGDAIGAGVGVALIVAAGVYYAVNTGQVNQEDRGLLKGFTAAIAVPGVVIAVPYALAARHGYRAAAACRRARASATDQGTPSP